MSKKFEKYLNERKGQKIYVIYREYGGKMRATYDKRKVREIQDEMKREAGLAGASDTRVNVDEVEIE